MQLIVSGYELKKQIGVGGFSDVYQAVHLITKREVALKLIAPSQDTPEYRQRFEAEIQITSRLEHPQIIPIYDYRLDVNIPYMSMRWVRGGTLADLLASQYRFTLQDAVHITSQIASALQYSHQFGIIHQDIKPSNVLLDEDGNAYLADFGIAYDQINDVDLSTGNSDSVLGSPSHMAPERITRKPTSPQTDIYSLGIMLYEMLVGRVPFQHSDLKQIWRMHLYDATPLVSAVRPELPDQVDWVIQRATRKHPTERYVSVQAMCNELHQLIGNHATSFSGTANTAGLDAFTQPTRVFDMATTQ